jgi:hypothetical protein
MSDLVKVKLKDISNVRSIAATSNDRFQMYDHDGSVYNITKDVYMVLRRMMVYKPSCTGLYSRLNPKFREYFEKMKKYNAGVPDSRGYTVVFTVEDDITRMAIQSIQDDINELIE